MTSKGKNRYIGDEESIDDEVRYDYQDDFYARDDFQYVPNSERKRRAEARKSELLSESQLIEPVVIKGRKISTTFWGQAWCDHLEAYHNYENRLVSGRNYLRSGCVVDLQITPGLVKALVEGNALYEIEIKISTLDDELWQLVVRDCAGEISSLVDLLSGRLSDHVMRVLTNAKAGVFPMPKEVKMFCSCPDYATVCKHVAAVMYGVGHRLDTKPELLFTLRSVNQGDLIVKAGSKLATDAAEASQDLAMSELEDLFGIDLGSSSEPAKPQS